MRRAAFATAALLGALAPSPAVGVETLGSTPYLDAEHPAIVRTAARVTAGAASPRERAVRIHDFVRDQIAFGFAGRFYDQRASDVLRSGVGFCNTKSTLFVALLRAAGIPARQRFVDLDARVLAGLIDPGTAYVDHSIAEVRLAERWIRVDSFIVDRTLAEVAGPRLVREGRWLGYGVHRNGTSHWDGTHDAFVQLVDDGSVPALTRTEYGVFADVGAFYARGARHNRLGLPARIAFPLLARVANARAAALRRVAR